MSPQPRPPAQAQPHAQPEPQAQPRAQALVHVAGLAKHYQQGGVPVPVLAGLDLDLQRGESLAVLGVSGTGKSTLLNVLSGIDTADAGLVQVDGQDLTRLDARALARFRRQKVGFVFQFYNLIPTLTALENVMSGWEAAGLPAAEAEAASQDMLAALGLAAKGGRFPEQLSGGEQQRVAIARALVKRPALVLADEPTGNLDPKTAESTIALLLEQAQRSGGALLIVTHNPGIGAHTDRTLVLRDGRLVANAPVPIAGLAALASQHERAA
jgi:ABC-type lipoprotein export system ATPase subunit